MNATRTTTGCVSRRGLPRDGTPTGLLTDDLDYLRTAEAGRNLLRMFADAKKQKEKS